MQVSLIEESDQLKEEWAIWQYSKHKMLPTGKNLSFFFITYGTNDTANLRQVAVIKI